MNIKRPNQIKIEKFAKKFVLMFKDKELLENAFVHRSYLNENPGFSINNNERLEFLGDAVLELITTQFLYDKFKNKSEGELTAIRSALVRGQNLSQIAKNLGIFECMYLSTGEKSGSEKARSLILANCLEAIIGAIYLDLGYKHAELFVNRNILSRLEKILSEKLYIDSKSELQEKVQEQCRITPIYKVISEQGPDHNKQFESGVYVGNDLVAKGKGSSKNQAEQDAAKNALEKLAGD